jgi:hypothetical protein
VQSEWRRAQTAAPRTRHGDCAKDDSFVPDLRWEIAQAHRAHRTQRDNAPPECACEARNENGRQDRQQRKSSDGKREERAEARRRKTVVDRDHGSRHRAADARERDERPPDRQRGERSQLHGDRKDALRVSVQRHQRPRCERRRNDEKCQNDRTNRQPGSPGIPAIAGIAAGCVHTLEPAVATIAETPSAPSARSGATGSRVQPIRIEIIPVLETRLTGDRRQRHPLPLPYAEEVSIGHNCLTRFGKIAASLIVASTYASYRHSSLSPQPMPSSCKRLRRCECKFCVRARQLLQKIFRQRCGPERPARSPATR